MRRRQWTWQPHGWHFMMTIGAGWGLGFMVLGRNGTDIYLGPVVFSAQPPIPESWKFMSDEEIASDKSKIKTP